MTELWLLKEQYAYQFSSPLNQSLLEQIPNSLTYNLRISLTNPSSSLH